jgi:hypothetical protein
VAPTFITDCGVQFTLARIITGLSIRVVFLAHSITALRCNSLIQTILCFAAQFTLRLLLV